MLVACTGRLPGHHAADVVVVAEHLAKAISRSPWKIGTVVHRSGTWPMRAGGIVGSFQKKTSPGLISSTGKYSKHRLDDRRVGAAGQLAPARVEQRDAVVVLVADHRRAGRALDRGLDLELGRADRALDHLERDRAQLGARGARPSAAPLHDQVAVAVDPGRPAADGRTVVEPNSSTIAGPLERCPGARSARRWIGQSTKPSPSK